MMWIGVVSLFPEMFSAITEHGIISKAIKNGIIKIEFWNPRDFSSNGIVDGKQYGGGSGMLLMIEPIFKAIQAAKNISGKDVKVIYLSPQGVKLTQQYINKFYIQKIKKIILLCGRYKGIDERIIYSEVDEEVSIGDYIVSGGELPAMILIDAIARLLPGVIKTKQSIIEDSFFSIDSLLDFPHYAYPRMFNGLSVPKVLISGNHKNIKKWRLKQSLGRTWKRRPQLLEKIVLNVEERELLEEFKQDNKFI